MSKKTTRIATDELSMFAAQGVERALEARKAAGVELNQDELNQVGGGALLFNPGILAGWILNQAVLGSIATTPQFGNVNTIARF